MRAAAQQSDRSALDSEHARTVIFEPAVTARESAITGVLIVRLIRVFFLAHRMAG